MINEEKRKLQLEALEALRENDFKGMVILPTGSGKTWVLIEALKEIYKENMSVLYTCDSKRLRDEEFDAELSKWGCNDFADKIQKECYATAYKHSECYWDILLADEADYAMTPEYSKLFLNNKFKYIILVSATLDRKKMSLAKSIAPIVYRKDVKEVEEKKIVNKAKFTIFPYVLNTVENSKYLDYNRRFTGLMNSSIKDKEDRLKALSFDRMHFMSNLGSSVVICNRIITELLKHKSNSKILIFCSSNKQADRVCKYSYHTANENIENLERFNKGEIRVLSVCGKIDRGVNLNGVNVIILESFTRSETKMIQRIGRGKRLDVDDLLSVFIPLPYYKRGKRTVPTIAEKWIKAAGRNVGIEKASYHYLK